MHQVIVLKMSPNPLFYHDHKKSQLILKILRERYKSKTSERLIQITIFVSDVEKDFYYNIF